MGTAAPCTILAIDGGGIRGAIPATLLALLEAKLGDQPLYTMFDVVAGTSTGGIIALGLTTPPAQGSPPLAASAIQQLYLNDEAQLFVSQGAGYTEAQYYAQKPGTQEGIEPFLQSMFGSTTLSQAASWIGGNAPTQVLTTGFTINGAAGVTAAPYLFNWRAAAAAPGGPDDYCVWEAARGTGAAPKYFPAAHVGGGSAVGPMRSNATERWIVDGGTVANNPAMYALAEAARLGLFQSLSDVYLVSLGTGLFSPLIADQTGDTADYNWGIVPWGSGTDTSGDTIAPLLDVMGNGNILAPDAQLAALLPAGCYVRIDPPITFAESSMNGSDPATLAQVATDWTTGAGASIWQSLVSRLTSP